MSELIYPDFIKTGDKIGVTACSDGRVEVLDIKRLEHAIEQWSRLGYHIIETSDVRTSQFGRSADARCRVKELNELLKQKDIRAIFQVSGGDYLCEIFPYLNFELFLENPKWLQGFSDPTGLLYLVTVSTGIATIYGNNFCEFGMKDWDLSIHRNIQFLEGKLLKQDSYKKFMNGYKKRKTGLEGYDLNQKVHWKALTDGNRQFTKEIEKKITMSGRLLGGCLDVLLEISGTRFDKTKEFCSKEGKDGIVWYLESFLLNSEQLYLGLLRLKETGWFETAEGFWFGRPAFYESAYDIAYEDAIYEALKDLHVPIILDADFGHLPPRMTVVNGAFGTVVCEHGMGSLEMKLC